MTTTSIASFLSAMMLIALSAWKPEQGEPRGCASAPSRVPLVNASRPLPDADFVVTANGSQQWLVNGLVNPTLTLLRGQTYTFDLTTINDEHPFVINSSANNPFGVQYAGPAYGSVMSFTPTNAMPATIHYHCVVHYGSMAGIIDLGPAPPCFGDLDQNLAVNVMDFGIFVGAYGSICSGCPADLDHNGTVNVADFGLFVGAFGSPCD